MRKLGQELGVEAMSLYNHVANKDDLLDGMVEMVMVEVNAVRAEAPDGASPEPTGARCCAPRYWPLGSTCSAIAGCPSPSRAAPA